MNYLTHLGIYIIFSVLSFSLLICFCVCNETVIRVERDTEGVTDEDMTGVETACSRDFKRESHQLHRQILCRPPRKKLVEVKMSSMYYMPGVVVWPHSYEVERCDGHCQHQNHKCLAIEKEIIEVPVYSRLLSTGQSGPNKPAMTEKCMRVKIEKHMTCGCQCAMNEKSCSDKQRFSSDRCACECTDMSRAGTCAQNSRMWSNEKCDCVCPPMARRECSSGAMFDEQTCRCMES